MLTGGGAGADGKRGRLLAGPARGRTEGGARLERQAGMVTAELAFASLGAVLIALALAWALAVLGLALRCQDTAAEVARQEARTDRDAVAKAIADRPEGARVQVSNRGGRVVVTVRLDARPWTGFLPAIPLVTTATVLREP